MDYRVELIKTDRISQRVVFSGIRKTLRDAQDTAYVWLRCVVNTHDVYVPPDPIDLRFASSANYPENHHTHIGFFVKLGVFNHD